MAWEIVDKDKIDSLVSVEIFNWSEGHYDTEINGATQKIEDCDKKIADIREQIKLENKNNK